MTPVVTVGLAVACSSNRCQSVDVLFWRIMMNCGVRSCYSISSIISTNQKIIRVTLFVYIYTDINISINMNININTDTHMNIYIYTHTVV